VARAADASADGKGDVTSMEYNQFKAFVQECDLDVPGSKYCDSAHYDMLFIKINSTQVKGGRSTRLKGRSEIEFNAETVGRQGMATTEGGRNEDKREICRHEWLNILIRIAVMRYIQTDEAQDISRAVERLLEMIRPKLDAWVTMDHQDFRRSVCYTEAVDAVLVEHKSSLVNVFNHFADTEGGTVGKKKERTLMSLPEWQEMVRELDLLDDVFTVRDATVIFVLSRMRCADEEAKSSVLRMHNLSLEDWFEALCRVAVIKALPTDDEVQAASAIDAGDFILELKESPLDYDEWAEAWYSTHTTPMMKATQPAHRCLSHLVLLMVRTIEGITTNQDAHDQKVTKKEMNVFASLRISALKSKR